jgi:hypothetical protein
MIKEKFELTVMQYELKRCEELYTSGILQNSNYIFSQSVFIEMMVRLNDLLQWLRKNGQRISFKDDVSGKGIIDITDLVNKIRNAACHERTSGEGKIDSIIFVFNRVVGKGTILEFGKVTIGSDYADDIAFFYGDKKIYLIRHIQKLLNEIHDKLELIK